MKMEGAAAKRRRDDNIDEELLKIETGIVKSLREESCKVSISEIYSPPRVTAEAKNWGLRPGEAMDLTTGWDFRRQEHRDLAWSYVDKYKPELLIGSPMCTMFSTLQNMTPLVGRQNKQVEGSSGAY